METKGAFNWPGGYLMQRPNCINMHDFKKWLYKCKVSQLFCKQERNVLTFSERIWIDFQGCFAKRKCTRSCSYTLWRHSPSLPPPWFLWLWAGRRGQAHLYLCIGYDGFQCPAPPAARVSGTGDVLNPHLYRLWDALIADALKSRRGQIDRLRHAVVVNKTRSSRTRTPGYRLECLRWCIPPLAITPSFKSTPSVR